MRCRIFLDNSRFLLWYWRLFSEFALVSFLPSCKSSFSLFIYHIVEYLGIRKSVSISSNLTRSLIKIQNDDNTMTRNQLLYLKIYPSNISLFFSREISISFSPTLLYLMQNCSKKIIIITIRLYSSQTTHIFTFRLFVEIGFCPSNCWFPMCFKSSKFSEFLFRVVFLKQIQMHTLNGTCFDFLSCFFFLLSRQFSSELEYIHAWGLCLLCWAQRSLVTETIFFLHSSKNTLLLLLCDYRRRLLWLHWLNGYTRW